MSMYVSTDNSRKDDHLVCEAGLFEYALAFGDVLCDLAGKVRNASRVQVGAQRTEGSWVPIGIRQKSAGEVRGWPWKEIQHAPATA